MIFGGGAVCTKSLKKFTILIASPRRVHTGVTLFLLVALGHAQGSSLRISYPGSAGFNIPIWVQKEAGLDRKYGLDLELVLITGGLRSIQALIAGDIHFAETTAPAVIRAGVAGAELAVVTTTGDHVTFKVVTRRGIRRPQELAGKKVAIASRGGSSEMGLLLALKKWGLDVNQVTVLSLGSGPTRLAALRKEVVDAALLAYPDLMVSDQLGLPVLADLRQVGKLTDISVVASRAFLKKQRPIVKRFIMGYAEAVWLLKRDPEIAYRALSRYAHLTDRPTAEATYRFYKETMPDIPKASPEGWKNLLAAVTVREEDASRFLDHSLLMELEREGFFERLAR